MKKRRIVSGLATLVVLFSVGCATTKIQPATIELGVIKNPTIGWAGYELETPKGLRLTDFLERSAQIGTEAEQMATRLFQRGWNKRERTFEWEWERFGEAFSFKDPEGKTCFLVTAQVLTLTYPVPMFSHMLSSEKRALYNAVIRRMYYDFSNLKPAKVGGKQALFAYGTAFEKNGVTYEKSGSGRKAFDYAVCIFLGDTRDVYTIVGCADPDDASLLKHNMQSLISGFSFL